MSTALPIGRLDEAIYYVEKFAEGIDPITGIDLPEDNILLNPKIIRSLFYLKSTLAKVRSGELCNRSKESFPLEVLKEYRYIGDTGITNLIKQLYAPVAGENFCALSPQLAGSWMREHGYLSKDKEGNVLPTNKGKKIGIYTITRKFQGKEFKQIMYNRQAQQFVIDHFAEMLVYKKD